MSLAFHPQVLQILRFYILNKTVTDLWQKICKNSLMSHLKFSFVFPAAVSLWVCGWALPALHPQDADCLVREAGRGVDHLRVQAQQVGQQGPFRAQPCLRAGVRLRYIPIVFFFFFPPPQLKAVWCSVADPYYNWSRIQDLNNLLRIRIQTELWYGSGSGSR